MRARILYAAVSAAILVAMAGRLALTDRPVLGEAACAVAAATCMLGACLAAVAVFLAIPALLLLLACKGVCAWMSRKPAPVPAAPGDARKVF